MSTAKSNKPTKGSYNKATSVWPHKNASLLSGAGDVRIIGGQWKRTKLPVANVLGLRPTPNRVRETLFNWLGQDLQGWCCLDAFAGSGALGFEAASRGAQHVTLVEKERKLVQSLQEVKHKLQACQVDVICGDFFSVLQQYEAQRFDLIFLDPPFDSDIFEEALQSAKRVISSTGIIYLEADRVVQPISGLSCYRHEHAGAVYYYLFTINPPS